MQRRRTEIDVKLLLFAINKTSQFEDLLGKRFSGCSLSESGGSGQTSKANKKVPLDQEPTEAPEDADPLSSPFRNLIGECFKPYLDIYTESIDRNLSELIEKFLQVAKQQSVATSLESCAELFIFYKKSLVQCTQLSNGKTMFDLVLVYKKYLREYAQKVLENQTPKVSAATAASISTSMSLLKQKDFQNLQSAANQVIHSFMKEGEVPRYTKEERVLICKILTTSEYCLETVQQLEEKLKEKIDSTYAESIDMSEEKDVFHRVISHCIQLLVQDIENLCEGALIVMTKVSFRLFLASASFISPPRSSGRTSATSATKVPTSTPSFPTSSRPFPTSATTSPPPASTTRSSASSSSAPSSRSSSTISTSADRRMPTAWGTSWAASSFSSTRTA
jgi:vacuolar protein sorting-associated protein 53